MEILLNVLIILVASVALIMGVNLFVKSTTQIAQHFKISGYTISFFLVAIGTSLPELVVAITATTQGNPILAYGNAMGSNIALLTIIVGIPAIISVTGISTRTILNSKDIYYTTMFSLLPVVMMIDGTLARIDGIILILAYIVYARFVLRRATGIEQLVDKIGDVNIFKQLGIFLVALAILLVSSELIVNSAVNIGQSLLIGVGIIGLTVTALGTSLPELAYTIGAIRKGENEGVLGDIVGSVVANSTLVLGVAAIINPLVIAHTKIGIPTIFFLILALLVFLRFARTKERIDTAEGSLLTVLYVIFVVIGFLIAQESISVGF
jgi:cation:H+ antiporter